MPDVPAPIPLQYPTLHELADRLDKAEEAIRARDDFLAVAAHELRSPLHALAMRMSVLERMASQTGNVTLAQELERAARSVDRYVRRAVALLDLSRVHAGVLRPTLAPVDAAQLVRDVVQDMRDEADYHGASLHAQVDEDLTGEWDAHMLEQVIVNLVSNAIKYGDGTPVHVRGYRADAQHACFEVSDEGPGIGEADRRRIFEKFERVVSGTVQRAGFGLGLWIVGRMVAAHQGSIDVTNQPSGGAVFRVLLPLRAQEQEDEAA